MQHLQVFFYFCHVLRFNAQTYIDHVNENRTLIYRVRINSVDSVNAVIARHCPIFVYMIYSSACILALLALLHFAQPSIRRQQNYTVS